MNLYHIKRHKHGGWDTYSNFVVAAESAEAAFATHPRGEPRIMGPDPTRVDLDGDDWEFDSQCREWVRDISEVTIRLIGTASDGVEAGVICASFHAG